MDKRTEKTDLITKWQRVVLISQTENVHINCTESS